MSLVTGCESTIRIQVPEGMLYYMRSTMQKNRADSDDDDDNGNDNNDDLDDDDDDDDDDDNDDDVDDVDYDNNNFIVLRSQL